MEIVKLLTRYLDTGVDGPEIRQLCRAAIARRIREIKMATAQAVVQARSCDLMDDCDGSNAALQQASRLQREYHDFFAQWRSLEGLGNDGVAAAAPAGEEKE